MEDDSNLGTVDEEEYCPACGGNTIAYLVLTNDTEGRECWECGWNDYE